MPRAPPRGPSKFILESPSKTAAPHGALWQWRDPDNPGTGGSLAFEAGGTNNPPQTVVETVAEELSRLLLAQPAAPATIRAPKPLAQALAGLTQLNSFSYIQRHWAAVTQRAPLWLAGAPQERQGFPWVDRAQAIAHACLPGLAWGSAGPKWSHLPRAAYPDDDDCCICLNPLADTLPSGSWRSRAASGMFECTHAVCRACDLTAFFRTHRRGAGAPCPMCRQPRRAWVPLGP